MTAIDPLVLAGIPPRFRGSSFDEYDAQDERARRALAVVTKYASVFEERREVGGSMALLGRPGTGKTHLLCALARTLLPKWKVKYRDAWGLISAIKSTWTRQHGSAADTEEELIARLAGYDLLIIDEIGVQYGSPAELALVHRVIDLRYQAVRPTIVAGNVDLPGLIAYIGERAVSRLHENRGVVLTFDWDDYRMKR